MIKVLLAVLVVAAGILFFRFRSEEGSKSEYAILQKVQSGGSLRSHENFVVVSEGRRLVLLTYGISDHGVRKKIAVMLNPSFAPFFKQVPGYPNFRAVLSQSDLESIHRKYKIHPSVYSALP
jgi:hypothetical protein